MDGENFMENPIKMDDLGGPPLFLETPNCYDHNTIGIRIMVTFSRPSSCLAVPRFQGSAAELQVELVQQLWCFCLMLNLTVQECRIAIFPTDEHISFVGKFFHSHFKNITLSKLSNEKKGPWLFRVCKGLYYPVIYYIGIIINHYKDPVINQPV